MNANLNGGFVLFANKFLFFFREIFGDLFLWVVVVSFLVWCICICIFLSDLCLICIVRMHLFKFIKEIFWPS